MTNENKSELAEELFIAYILNKQKKSNQQPPIKFTKISCNDCGDIIQSMYSGDCVFCKCRKTMIDQTVYYTRTSGEFTIVKESE